MAEVSGYKLPDFVIIGAMKCGTSSIHYILAQHKDVFIPDGEPYFFDVDDIEQHPDFFVRTPRGWTYHDYERDFDRYLEWYGRFFEEARPGQIIGEDTTTYLASKKASERIARLLPDVRLIVMLRDPVSRAYSHYWHNVAAGRVTMDFDNTIRLQPGNYLVRGFYEEQLRRYEPFIKAERLKTVLFEDFLTDQQAVVDELCGYLGLAESVDLSRVDTHKNPAKVPPSIPLQLLGNRIYRFFSSSSSYRRIPNMPGYGQIPAPAGPGRPAPLAVRLYRLYSDVFAGKKYPPMNPETRTFLQKLYKRMNAGLSDLIGQDVARRWKYMAA